MPEKLVLSKEDRLECGEVCQGHRFVFATIQTELTPDDLLAIQEWCEDARAWLRAAEAVMDGNSNAQPVVGGEA
jgi:hypothetical protein